MSSKFSRWLTSKTGMQTLLGIAGVLLVVIILGAVLGWWADLIDLLSGTVAPPPPEYPPPMDGYTCLPNPDCSATDGKFFSMPGEQMQSFGGATTVMWISVPSQYTEFKLAFFDGDSGKGSSPGAPYWTGNWDSTTAKTTYTVYADQLKDGPPKDASGNPVAETAVWSATSDDMPNNDWYENVIAVTPEAQGPSGHYFYRLEVTRPVAGYGINAFKVRSDAYLSTGEAGLVDASFAIVGMVATLSDLETLYPNAGGNWLNPGESTYTGVWDFYFYVAPAEWPTRTVSIEIWDGDFDRGTTIRLDSDTDDPNTEGVPPWALASAQPEGVGGTYMGLPGQGAPADDSPSHLFRRNPPVRYTITNPAGAPIYTNAEPSGTEEWERFVISTESTGDPDEITTELEPGWYGLRIEGLDVHNTVWLRINTEVVTEPPPPPCDASCPRTIGYWKNNVKKVLAGKKSGVQETQESLEKALSIVAQESGFFCNGMDLTNPKEMSPCNPLTLEEANTILQRDTSGKIDYPGGTTQAQTMLARALQQNLASWLNLGSGKICKDSVITLDPAGGRFEGILWKALLEAKDIILNEQDNDARLERAKDIGDLINNGDMGEEADLEVATCDITDPDDANSKNYRKNFPPGLQPPKHDDKPKAPDPDPVDPPVVACTAMRENVYNVESPTNEPFYGIKFEYASGTEVKNGDYAEFRIILTAEEAAALTSVQLEAKAGENVGTATLEGCQFDLVEQTAACIAQDENGYFTFEFVGALANEDGTMDLIFYVTNSTDSGLSHVTIGLPEGVVPSSPSGNYKSEVCID